MRKLSLVGGVVLALAAATSTLAATPTAQTTAATSTAATLTWKATFSKTPVSGTAVLTATASHTQDKVVVRATGLTKGTKVTFRIFETVAGKNRAIASASGVVTLTSKGQLVRTWVLPSAERAAVKAALAHGDAISFRLIDGTTVASGLFAKA